MTRDLARARLMTWDANQPQTPSARSTPNLDLRPRRGTIPQPMEALAIAGRFGHSIRAIDSDTIATEASSRSVAVKVRPLRIGTPITSKYPPDANL